MFYCALHFSPAENHHSWLPTLIVYPKILRRLLPHSSRRRAEVLWYWLGSRPDSNSCCNSPPPWTASMPGLHTSISSMNDGCETSRPSPIIYLVSTTTTRRFVNWRVPPKTLLWGFTILTSPSWSWHVWFFSGELLNQWFFKRNPPVHSLILADLYTHGRPSFQSVNVSVRGFVFTHVLAI